MGFCTEEQYRRFLELCPEIEKYIVEGGIILLKYWLEVSNEEQERRFLARINDPLRQWKLSPMDLPSRTRWYDYSRARDEMLAGHGHQARTVAHPALRRQEACPAQLHLALVKPNSVQEAAAAEGATAQALEEGSLRRRSHFEGPPVCTGEILTVTMKLRLPLLAWLPQYQANWLRTDLIAGITLAAYLIPAGLGDASLANLPPEAGLYACLFAGLVFWLFCSSRHTAITVTSAISLLVGASLGELSGGDTARFAALAACTALLVGVLFLLGWLVRAGAIVNFVSETVLVGFKCGIALFLASTQLPKLFGFKGTHGDFWERTQLLRFPLERNERGVACDWPQRIRRVGPRQTIFQEQARRPIRRDCWHSHRFDDRLGEPRCEVAGRSSTGFAAHRSARSKRV